MKITHIITTLVYGGAEKLLVNFTKVHAETNYEIEIVYFKEEPNLKQFLHPSIKLIHIPLKWDILLKLRQYLKKSNPDIVHTHLGHADFIGLLASTGLKCAKFCTMHNIWFKWNKKDSIIFFFYKIWFAYIAPECKVISISKSVYNHVNNTLKVKQRNSFLIYNGIPLSAKEYNRNKEREKYSISSDSFLILFVGRLRIQKSVETLIQAFANIKQNEKYHLIIVGDGELRSKLELLSVSLKINKRVQFVGTTPEPEKFFAMADLFVLPSIFEGLGLVILEAFRSSLPVIASNIEGPKELIKNNFNGLLFEPGNHQQLSSLIESIYSDESLRNNLSKNGYTTFQNNFEINNYAKELEMLYNG